MRSAAARRVHLGLRGIDRAISTPGSTVPACAFPLLISAPLPQEWFRDHSIPAKRGNRNIVAPLPEGPGTLPGRQRRSTGKRRALGKQTLELAGGLGLVGGLDAVQPVGLGRLEMQKVHAAERPLFLALPEAPVRLALDLDESVE